MHIPEEVAGVPVLQSRTVPGIVGGELQPEPRLLVNPGLTGLLTDGQLKAVLAYSVGELAAAAEAEREPEPTMTEAIIAAVKRYGVEVVECGLSK